jgi:hypothetical protein
MARAGTSRHEQAIVSYGCRATGYRGTDFGNGYRALPFSANGKQFFRCPDCYAVWLASSIFERVSEEEVCGVYDMIPIWTPHPWMEKGK